MVFSTVAEIQQNNANKYIDKIRKMKKENPDEAKEFARKELIEMGLLSRDGKRKKTIVSWE